MSATLAFKAVTDSVTSYTGLRYPDLKDESNPASANYEVTERDVSSAVEKVTEFAAGLPSEGSKDMVRPKVGHKLHRLTTMTEKTNQFHLLANGNPKPKDLLVSPLVQFNLDGTPKESNGDGQSKEAEDSVEVETD